MRRETINYFTVGLFVLAGIGFLLLVLYRMTGAGVSTDTYYTYYRNVAGVMHGTLVTYEGYSVGQVAAIEPQRDDSGLRYRVALELKKGWQIPVNSVASVTSAGLLADTVVNINEGDATDYLQPGGEVRGRAGVDLFAVLGDVAADFGDLSEDAIKPLITTLHQTVSRLSQDIESRLPGILERIDSMAGKLDDSATHVAAIVNEQTETQARRILNNTDKAAEAFNHLSGSLLSVQSDVTHLIRELDGLVSESRPDVQKSLLDLRDTLEQVSRSSGDILMNLEGAARNMNEFSRRVRENPASLLTTKAPEDQR